MSISGFPTDPERRGSSEGAGSGEPPADDWNAQFTAIVSGISGSMRWEVTDQELDDGARGDGDGFDDPGFDDPAGDEDSAAGTRSGHGAGRGGSVTGTAGPPVYPRPRELPWTSENDTAETRRMRREMRRQERADALAAHLQAKAEFEAELAADEEHYIPPPPPPIPRPKRRTVAALLLIAVGILILAWPALLPVSGDVIIVLSLVLIVGGLTILVMGMRAHRGEPGEGWDDGAEV